MDIVFGYRPIDHGLWFRLYGLMVEGTILKATGRKLWADRGSEAPLGAITKHAKGVELVPSEHIL